jgi:hypothetical protein
MYCLKKTDEFMCKRFNGSGKTPRCVIPKTSVRLPKQRDNLRSIKASKWQKSEAGGRKSDLLIPYARGAKPERTNVRDETKLPELM